jgi:transcriptional regulator with XRE-family HTH domain
MLSVLDIKLDVKPVTRQSGMMLDVRSGREVASTSMGGDNAQLSGGDWAVVAEAIRNRRNELGLTQQKLASDAAVSLYTIQELEKGRPRNRQPRTLSVVSLALRRPEGWLDAVLRGMAPSVAGAADVAESREDLAGAIREIRDELGRITRRLDALEAEDGR